MDDPRTDTRFISKDEKRCADTGSVAGGTETEYFRNPWRVVVTRNKGVCRGEGEGGEGKYCKWWRAKEREGNGDGN